MDKYLGCGHLEYAVDEELFEERMAFIRPLLSPGNRAAPPNTEDDGTPQEFGLDTAGIIGATHEAQSIN